MDRPYLPEREAGNTDARFQVGNEVVHFPQPRTGAEFRAMLECFIRHNPPSAEQAEAARRADLRLAGLEQQAILKGAKK